ncbi:MAG: HAMP domain-containing protein, partial [Planctomycetes bacterium]|nr:HAMP domain-containing protein [Planctomycetota bacterium]
MLRKLRIGPRLIVLIAVQTLVAIAVGSAGLLGLGFAATSTEELSRNVQEGTRLSYLAETLRSEVLDGMYGVNLGVLTWQEGRDRLAAARARLDEDWQEFRGGLSADEAEFVDDVLTPGFNTAREALDELGGLLDAEDQVNLSLFLVNDARDLISPFVNAVLASTAERQLLAEETFELTLATSRNFLFAAAGVLAIGLLVSGVLGFFIFRSIVGPIGAIERTVHRVAEGDWETRTTVTGRDEPGQLGEALDSLLEDRVANLARAERENEALNESVLRLLDAVAVLSERDLTVLV